MSRATASDGISRQRYLEEIIRKERDSMIEWYFKSKQRSADGELDEEHNKSRQYEVFRKKLERQRLQPSEAQLRLRQKHLELPSIVKDPERTEATTNRNDDSHQTGSSLPPLALTMEPADGATKRMLYEGLSSEGRGRHSYLRTRNNLGPDQKYHYPVLSSWEYGWRLEEAVNDALRNPIHGRTKVIHETFYRRNGIPELSMH